MAIYSYKSSLSASISLWSIVTPTTLNDSYFPIFINLCGTLPQWLCAWLCDLLWTTGYQQKWHKQRYMYVCVELPLLKYHVRERTSLQSVLKVGPLHKWVHKKPAELPKQTTSLWKIVNHYIKPPHYGVVWSNRLLIQNLVLEVGDKTWNTWH